MPAFCLAYPGDQNQGCWVKQTSRLTRSTDIKRVRRLGKSYAHPLVVLTVMPNELPVHRSAIVTSHTVGKAVDRNLARRRTRACLIEFAPWIAPGVDMVWVIRAPFTEAEFQDIQKAICTLLSRAGIFKRDCTNA